MQASRHSGKVKPDDWLVVLVAVVSFFVGIIVCVHTSDASECITVDLGGGVTSIECSDRPRGECIEAGGGLEVCR